MSQIRLDDVPAARKVLVAPVTVLFVESNADTVELVKKALLGAAAGTFRIEWAASLADALERLARSEMEVVLAGMNLPDCPGLEVFERLRQAAPQALLLPLASRGCESAHAEGHKTGPTENTKEMNWLPNALHHVAQRKSTEAAWRAENKALFEEKERARITLGSVGDAVLVTDTQGNVTYLNQVAESLTGWSCAMAIGQPLPEVFNITDRDTGKRANNPALHAMAENTTVGLAANCVLQLLDGTEARIEDSAAPVHDRFDQITGAVIVCRDVNQSRVMINKMAWLASHDTLTGAASGALLEERFNRIAGLTRPHAGRAAILFVELDNLKKINGVFGDDVGDLVLQAVAGSLKRGVREADTICRHGGDHFVVLLADVTNPAAAEQAVTNMIEEAVTNMLGLFTAALSVDGNQVKVAMTIGISMYPDDGNDLQSLIDQAHGHHHVSGRDQKEEVALDQA